MSCWEGIDMDLDRAGGGASSTSMLFPLAVNMKSSYEIICDPFVFMILITHRKQYAHLLHYPNSLLYPSVQTNTTLEDSPAPFSLGFPVFTSSFSSFPLASPSPFSSISMASDFSESTPLSPFSTTTFSFLLLSSLVSLATSFGFSFTFGF